MYLLKQALLIIIFIFLFFESPLYSQDVTSINGPIKLEARIDVPLELNLEKALDIALLQNLDFLKARYEKNIEKWKFWENIGNWLPDYSLGLSDQRFDGSFLIGGVLPIMALTSSANAFMRFDYRFFEGGKGLFNTLAARKLFKSSSENLTASMKNTLLATAQSYNYLLREQGQLDVLSKAVQEAQSVLDLNQKLLNQGTGTKFNVLQAEAELAEQEQAFISEQAKFREASINLARVLNLEQGVHIKPDNSDLAPKKLFNIDKPITEIIAVAKNNRPELKKAQFEYSAQKSYVTAAFSGFLPRANFFGQYGGTGNVFFHRTKIREVIQDAIALDNNGNPVPQMVSRERTLYQTVQPQVDLTNITNVSNVIRGAGSPFLTAVDDSLMTSRFIGIQVDWLLGDGLGLPTISRINQAKGQAKLAKTNLEILNKKIEEDVRKAYLKIQVTEKLLEVAKKRENAATEALHLAKVRLENGVGINTELLNAEKQYAESIASSVNAIIEYNNAQAELLHSLGLISVETLLAKK